jgi:Flp pilus assembly protein TadD
MATHTLFRTTLALGTALILSGCVAIAPPMTEQEQDVAATVNVNQYLPASREMRDNIETQELFAQAAFWSHEYDLNPSDLEAAIKLAAAVRKLGNPSRSVEITQTSRAIHPRDPYLLAEHAAGLIADGRALDAMPVLDQGLSLAPQYARLWSLKGAALDQQENYQSARQHYSRALQITPTDPNILANIGLSHALSGDPATAEVWLRRAVALPGASAGVRQNLALVLQLQGKTSESQQQARTASLSRGDQRLPPPPVAALTPRGVPNTATAPTRRQPARARQAARPAQTVTQSMPAPTAPNYGRPNMPGARLTTTAPSGQQFRSSADAARAAAMQSQRSTTQSAGPLPTTQNMNMEQRSVLDQIARNIGPQRAMPAPQGQIAPQHGANVPHVVGPPLRTGQPQTSPQGYPVSPATASVPVQTPYGAQPERRGAARSRR